MSAKPAVPLGALALISASVLAYEIVLARVFAIVHWHHFAFMIISMALLGFGASGMVLAFVRERLRDVYREVFAGCAALFALSAVLAVFALQAFELNVDRMVWEPWRLMQLPLMYLTVGVPFFFGASCIGVMLTYAVQPLGRVYGADLLGAGCGAIGAMLIMDAVPPSALTGVVVLPALLAGVLGWSVAVQRPGWHAVLVGTVLVGSAGLLAWHMPSFRISEYKPLSVALAVPGAERVAERFGPLGHVTVVASPAIPLRHAPGLALTARARIPEQLAVFVDGAAPTAITRFDGDLDSLGYLDASPQALVYHLRKAPQTLILGAVSGTPVLRALAAGAKPITAVELNGDLVTLVNRDVGAFSGRPFSHADVSTWIGSERTALHRTEVPFDAVVVPLEAGAGSANALGAAPLHTVEGVSAMLAALAPDGFVSLSLWTRLPPRGTLKLFSTVLAALREHGVSTPSLHVAVIRGWNTATLVVKRTPLTVADEARIRAFTAERGFDLAYLPHMRIDEANQRNILERPLFANALSKLAGPQATLFSESYKFDIRPATDDRPYFQSYFRWLVLPELIALPAQGEAALVDWTYLFGWATLLQAAVLAALLIIAPLVLGARPARTAVTPHALICFASLGVAFLLVEVALMQRFQVFLGHPMYTFGIVLTAFLVCAGFGARASAGSGATGMLRSVRVVTMLIAALTLAYTLFMPVLLDAFAQAPLPFRVALTVGLVAPLAFLMGLPFPLVLDWLSRDYPALVPWAWGVNGCGSVLSPVLATLMGIDFGFTVVLVLAATLYVCAGFVLPRAKP